MTTGTTIRWKEQAALYQKDNCSPDYNKKIFRILNNLVLVFNSVM